MRTPAITLIFQTVRFPEHRFKEYFYLDFFTKEKRLASQVVFLIKSMNCVLANIWYIMCLGILLRRIIIQSSFFSETKLCTRPLKNIKNFLCKKKLVNNPSIPLTHAERKITNHSHKHSFTPYASLSPYWQTDEMTDGGTNTLAARGLENLFFQLCCCVSFWFWREIGLGFTYLCT